MTLLVGTRVRLNRPVDRYPHFLAPVGMVGTVTMADYTEAVCVKMDDRLLGAEEWDNEVQWYPQNGDDPDADVDVLTKPHPTNPYGVLVACANCGTEIHIPRVEADQLDFTQVACRASCMEAIKTAATREP